MTRDSDGNSNEMMSDAIKVDMHIHLYPRRDIGVTEKSFEVWEYGDYPDIIYSECCGTIDEIGDQMRRSGVSKSVLLIYFKGEVAKREALSNLIQEQPAALDQESLAGIDREIARQLEELNKWGCSISRENSSISTFVTADVSVQAPDDAAQHVEIMVRDYQAKGVKLHSALQGFSMSDRRLWPLYRVCEALDVPVLGHAGPDRGGRGISDPNAFAEMLEAFPKLRVVVAHMGGAAWRQTAAIAQRYRNAVFDCSEIMHWTGAPGAPTDLELAELIKRVGPDRVMMGSDFPWYDLDASVKRVLQLPVLSEREKEGILGSNAVRLLGI